MFVGRFQREPGRHCRSTRLVHCTLHNDNRELWHILSHVDVSKHPHLIFVPLKRLLGVMQAMNHDKLLYE
jgi:hypothetical protein